MDKDGNKVGENSVTAARWGISQVIHIFLLTIFEPETSVSVSVYLTFIS